MPPFRLPYTSHRNPHRRRRLILLLPLLLLLTLLTPFYIIYKPPSLLINYFAYRWPDVLFQVTLSPTTPPMVALTIDDAPSQYTRDILRVLKEIEATATFFVIGGQVGEKEDVDVLVDVVRAGNELGNHAMRDQPSRDLCDAELEEQILRVERVIEGVYGVVAGVSGAERRNQTGSEDIQGQSPSVQSQYIGPPTKTPSKYFRPGSGFFSTRMRTLAQKLGYRIVLGNVYPHDPQINLPWVNAAHILSMVKPGSIIIIHDRRQWTIPMLETVLPELRKRGYRVVTVTELLRFGV
ncbi:hypothetical protein HDV00_007029 [Rhizophlyctis rosea]|nr:hypothetical protein HDV00_007029 [Rhizophlyctis rosea]